MLFNFTKSDRYGTLPNLFSKSLKASRKILIDESVVFVIEEKISSLATFSKLIVVNPFKMLGSLTSRR